MRDEGGEAGKWRRTARVVATARAAGISETRWTPAPQSLRPRKAVHQELVRKLAEQARINRLRDQLRRARPDAGSWLAPAASLPFAVRYSGGPAIPGAPAGLTSPGDAVTLSPPAPPAPPAEASGQPRNPEPPALTAPPSLSAVRAGPSAPTERTAAL